MLLWLILILFCAHLSDLPEQWLSNVIVHTNYFGMLSFSLDFFFKFIVVFLTPKTFCIGVQPINNVMIVSGWEGTQPYIYMYPFCLKHPSHPGWHITLSRVPCGMLSKMQIAESMSRISDSVSLRWSLEMFIFKIIPSPSSDALRKHITGL